jgi:hypothetical protein
VSITNVVKLKEKEKILAVVRHFPLLYLHKVLLAALLIAAPFFFMMPLLSLPMPKVGVAVFSVAVFAGLLYALRVFVIWYWNAFVITTVRIVDVDQRGLFDRVVSEASHDKVQDVSYRIKGLWGTVFKCGTLIVQTAGASANLELYYVRRPEDVQHLITEAVAAYQQETGGRTERVSQLLNTAASLNDAEARAFLTGLQGALKDKPPDAGVTDDDVEGLMEGDDE